MIRKTILTILFSLLAIGAFLYLLGTIEGAFRWDMRELPFLIKISTYFIVPPGIILYI